MTGYLLRRTGQMCFTLFLIVTLAFFLIQAQPGDYTSFYTLDPNLSPEVRDQVKATFGLDKSVWEQYAIHMKNTFTGNFGISFGHYPRSVKDVIWERLPRTAVLFLSATVVSFYFGFLMGKAIAWRRGGLLEYSATLSGAALFTVFTPWFGLMIIWLFAFQLGWFPVGKFLDPLIWRDAPVSADHVFKSLLLTAGAFSVFIFLVFQVARRIGRKWRKKLLITTLGLSGVVIALAWAASGLGHLALDIVNHMVLPILTLTLVSFAGTMLLTRNSMLETIREDYIVAARAKGVPERLIRDRHAARNALLPVVTSLVYSLVFAIDGSVIIEAVFSWPGIGQMLLGAVLAEDLPLVLGAFVFIGIFALIAHLLADVIYVFLDPRIRYQ